MDYTTCMTIIIICLFAMGCLCCVWITCCGIALMETKYVSTWNKFNDDNLERPFNSSLSVKELCRSCQTLPIKTITRDLLSDEELARHVSPFNSSLGENIHRTKMVERQMTI